jgi:hypothetical protein
MRPSARLRGYGCVMAVLGDRKTVTSAAALLLVDGNDWNGVTGILKNLTASASVYLGGDNTVTDTTGFAWDSTDGPLQLSLAPGEQLYARLASGATSQVIHRLLSSV